MKWNEVMYYLRSHDLLNIIASEHCSIYGYYITFYAQDSLVKVLSEKIPYMITKTSDVEYNAGTHIITNIDY